MTAKQVFTVAAVFLGVTFAGRISAQELTVSTISVTGNASLTEAKVAAAAGLKPGAQWTAEAADFTKAAITSLYRSSGFMNARVGISELKAGASVQISIEIDEGRLYYFGITTVSGLEKLRPNTVLKELAYRKGDSYGQEKLMASHSRLFATDWFESIRTGISSSAASEVISISLDVREKPLKWVKGGLGYASEEKERVSLGFTHNNLFRHGYKFEVNALFSRIWLEYSADFTNRHFLDSRTEMRNSSAWRLERRSGYDQESVRNTLSFGRKLAVNFSGSVQYRMQRTLIYNVDPGLADITPSLSRLNSAGIAFNRDNTDDFFYPTRGLRSELILERPGGVWGGDINLYKASLKNNVYQRIIPEVAIMLSARGAFVQETGSTREVPIYERLFTGGANSIRGYAERDVGPSDLDGNPTGDKVLLGANTELRFPVYKKLRGALFLDGGQVSGSLAGSAPAHWDYGAGAGLRYRTPVGPIRADFGYKLNPRRQDYKDRWRLHLSIGEAF